MNGEKQEGRHSKDVQFAFSTVDKRMGIRSEESAQWNQAKALAAIADALEAALPLLEKIANPLAPVETYNSDSQGRRVFESGAGSRIKIEGNRVTEILEDGA